MYYIVHQMAANQNETLLIKALKLGKEPAFKSIFEAYKEKVYQFSLKFVLCDDYAEEITQIVFIKLWETRNRIDENASLNPYLYVLTRNASLDYLRKTANDQQLRDKFLRTYENIKNNFTEDTIYLNELQQHTQQAIDTLPPKQQTIYKLAKHEHKRYDEIAQIMSISKNTVKTQLRLANEHVKAYLHKVYKQVISFLLFLMLAGQ